MMAKQKLNQMEAEIQAHTNDYAQVQANLKKIADIQQPDGRPAPIERGPFLQGNLLNALQQTYVPNVQLSRLRVDKLYYQRRRRRPRPTLPAASPGRPASTTEHVVLTLDAKDFSPNPGDQVQPFQGRPAQAGLLQAESDPDQRHQACRSCPRCRPRLDGKPYVMFTLECRFPDKTP